MIQRLKEYFFFTSEEKSDFGWLTLLASVGACAIIPYIHALIPGHLHGMTAIGITFIQVFIRDLVGIFFGLKLRRSVILPDLWETNWMGRAMLFGTLCGIAITALGQYQLFLNPLFKQLAPVVPVGYKLLAALYGSINEEIITRLFCVTLFIVLFKKILPSYGHSSMTIIMWTSITAASILFALGHMPAALALLKNADLLSSPTTPWFVLTILLGNSAAGMVFGWCYCRHGLLSAMVAHGTADLVLHVLAPLVLQ